jgi:hypothetical protein
MDSNIDSALDDSVYRLTWTTVPIPSNLRTTATLRTLVLEHTVDIMGETKHFLKGVVTT